MTTSLSCVICNGTGWGTLYSVPVSAAEPHGKMYDVFQPCSDHPPQMVPDRVLILRDAKRIPTKGVDFVRISDACLAGEPAINGQCGDLTCVCAPSTVDASARVVRMDDLWEQNVYLASDDQGETFTLYPLKREAGRMLIREPKAGWRLVGIRAFPADDPRDGKPQ